MYNNKIIYNNIIDMKNVFWFFIRFEKKLVFSSFLF